MMCCPFPALIPVIRVRFSKAINHFALEKINPNFEIRNKSENQITKIRNGEAVFF